MPDKTRERAERIERRAARAVATINGTAERLAEAVRTARADLERIDADERLTPDAKAEDRRAAEGRLQEAVEKAERENGKARERLDQLVERYSARDDRDPAASMLAEQRRHAAWQRAQRLLDAGDDPLNVAQRAADAGDRDTLDALRAELPSYLQAGGEDGRVRRSTLNAVDEIGGPLRTPIEQAAHDAYARVGEAADTAQVAANFVRADGSTADAIPAPDGGMIDLGRRGYREPHAGHVVSGGASEGGGEAS